MIKDIDGLLEHIEVNLQKRMDAAVVGLSGGADSTLVVLLAIRALGKKNVHPLHMPYSMLDEETFNSKSDALASHLGLNWDKTINIKGAVDALTVEFEDFKRLSIINQGNMRSRMRMIALYTHCCTIGEKTGKRVRVLGTGNLSEDIIGYDTKGGDALCDYFPIGSLVKSEVYQLLEYFRDQGIITEDMINRTPSAGLWDGQTDEDELGYTYNEMEPYVIDLYRGNFHMDGGIGQFVYERHIANAHKHQAPPVLELRSFCDDGDSK